MPKVALSPPHTLVTPMRSHMSEPSGMTAHWAVGAVVVKVVGEAVVGKEVVGAAVVGEEVGGVGARVGDDVY